MRFEPPSRGFHPAKLTVKPHVTILKGRGLGPERLISRGEPRPRSGLSTGPVCLYESDLTTTPPPQTLKGCGLGPERLISRGEPRPRLGLSTGPVHLYESDLTTTPPPQTFYEIC